MPGVTGIGGCCCGCDVPFSIACAGSPVDGALVEVGSSPGTYEIGSATSDTSGAATIQVPGADTWFYRVSKAGRITKTGNFTVTDCTSLSTVAVTSALDWTASCGSEPSTLWVNDSKNSRSDPLYRTGSMWSRCDSISESLRELPLCFGGFPTTVLTGVELYADGLGGWTFVRTAATCSGQIYAPATCIDNVLTPESGYGKTIITSAAVTADPCACWRWIGSGFNISETEQY